MIRKEVSHAFAAASFCHPRPTSSPAPSLLHLKLFLPTFLCCLLQCTVGSMVMKELKRIVEDSEIIREDDNLWPEPDEIGRQEFELVLGDEYVLRTAASRLPSAFCVRACVLDVAAVLLLLEPRGYCTRRFSVRAYVRACVRVCPQQQAHLLLSLYGYITPTH